MPASTALLRPGTWGCSHGSGFLGNAIRRAEQEMTETKANPAGDHQAAWAGHCFVFAGNQSLNGVIQPCIVEAEYPKTKLSPVTAHPDACWAKGQKLTAAQRQKGVAKAMSMVGTGYDWPAYGYFVIKALGMYWSKDLTPLFTDPAWIICSGIVVVTQEAMGVDLGDLKTAATADPSFVCPADCLRWGLNNNWMDSVPPITWK